MTKSVGYHSKVEVSEGVNRPWWPKTLVTKEKTLVTEGKTLVTKEKTLVIKDKTLVTQRYTLVTKYITEKIFLPNIAQKNIFLKNITEKIIFSKQFWNKYFHRKYFCLKYYKKKFCQIYFKNKVGVKSPLLPAVSRMISIFSYLDFSGFYLVKVEFKKLTSAFWYFDIDDQWGLETVKAVKGQSI